jgi:hypothetical protein
MLTGRVGAYEYDYTDNTDSLSSSTLKLVPYQCPVLHSAQMLAPAESILPAPMHYAGCTYFWN